MLDHGEYGKIRSRLRRGNASIRRQDADHQLRHARLRQSEQPQGVAARPRACWKTSSCARRSFTSTTSESPSASCTRAVRARMAISNAPIRSPTSAKPTCSRRSAQKVRRVRALLHRGGRRGLGRYAARRARLRRQILHAARQLGSRGQQHPGVLHSGRDQISRPHPFGENGIRSRLSAGEQARTTRFGISRR